jgi:hypothetical protein
MSLVQAQMEDIITMFSGYDQPLQYNEEEEDDDDIGTVQLSSMF